jgi:hypothetical protein
LKYPIGDQIRLSGGDLMLIPRAFFSEIESKYHQ